MSEGRTHRYRVDLRWTGNEGSGTISYRGYSRDHVLSIPGKPDIAGSSDDAFMGDPARWNPEDLLLASIAACHKLWYLHLCAAAGICVTAYHDSAEGIMVEDEQGGRFTGVTLRPRVALADRTQDAKALALHHAANAHCFIANSLNFKVEHEPSIVG